MGTIYLFTLNEKNASYSGAFIRKLINKVSNGSIMPKFFRMLNGKNL